MKKKCIFVLLIGLIFGFGIIGCSDDNNTNDDNPPVNNPEEKPNENEGGNTGNENEGGNTGNENEGGNTGNENEGEANKKTFTVTFNSNNGTSVPNQTVKEGEKVVQPSNPTKEGYKFIGWYLGEEQFDFNSKVTENITLVAKWEEVVIDENAVKLAEYKEAALEKLDEIVNPAIAKINDTELKTAVQNYYNTQKDYINSITDLDTAKEATDKVIVDTKAFVVNTLKPLAIEKLNSTVNPLIQKITHADLKESVQTFYNTEIDKVSSIDGLEDMIDLYKEVIDDTKEFIEEETEKIIIELKDEALEGLDPFVSTLISKIPFDSLKIDLQSFYNEQKSKLELVDTIEGITPCVNEIKEDLEDFALTETKKLAVKEIEYVVDEGLENLPNQEIKNDLIQYSEGQILLIDAIRELDEVPTTLATILEETRGYVKGLLVSTVKSYLSRLLKIENATAYDYLPEAMSPRYENNLVKTTDIDYDFSTFTRVSDIHKAGFGEQWQMVVENINQSVTFAKVFNVAQTALNAAGNAVDIYITNSYTNDMDYTFTGEGYNGVFEFKNRKLVFNINITKTVTVPGVGSVKPIIKMEYDLSKEVKAMYISLGDAYKVKYLVSDNAYEMATTYGITIAGKEASRSSYLSIVKNGSKTVGHIYEYTTVDELDMIKACADFYVENGYVSVVGNKASGMIAFDGYVNELYLASVGQLIGYEVREEKTIAGITGGYNTLWFNLSDISGITTIKVTDKTDANQSKLSTYDVYVNGSSTLFNPTYNTKGISILSTKTSRKYDIELRSRFYYTYDAENDTYISNEVKVPMMFIQEDNDVDTNFTDFPTDIKKDNNITASVSLNTIYLNKILADYDTLIDIFIVNKENMSSEAINEYLKQYD